MLCAAKLPGNAASAAAAHLAYAIPVVTVSVADTDPVFGLNSLRARGVWLPGSS
jgi:hypothetical protein